MTLTVRPVSNEDGPQWDALWKRSGSYLAHNWSWGELCAQGVGTPRRLAIVSGQGPFVAGFTFVERRVRGLVRWLTPTPAPWSGLMVGPDHRSESSLRDIFKALSDFLEGSPARNFELISPPAIQDLRGLIWSGWRVKPHYNYISRIDASDALANQSENSVRRQAQKARESGLELVQGPELLSDILQLWEGTRERQKIAAWVSPESYRAIVAMKEEGIASRVFAVRDPKSGSLEAGAVIGLDPQRAYYLLGASHIADGEKGSGAPSLLHLALTEVLFQERGPYIYDWVGANTPSIAQFKKKFRPELEVCLRASKSRGIAKLLNW